MNLDAKVAIVTGSGGKGAGHATARRFAQEGMAVVVSDVNDVGGHETVALIEADGGRAAFCRADMKNENEINALVAFAESAFGGLDILVNNASNPDAMGFLTGWTEAVAVEILAPMRATLAAVEAMRRRGGGAIVNIGSTSALGHGRKHSRWPAYDVGKMAQIRLTTTLACLCERENIRVNCLVPAWIASPGPKEYWESLTPEQRRERGAGHAALAGGGCRCNLAAGHGRNLIRSHHGVVERPTSEVHFAGRPGLSNVGLTPTSAARTSQVSSSNQNASSRSVPAVSFRFYS